MGKYTRYNTIHGFSLLELIVALVIISVIIASAGSFVDNALNDRRQKATMDEIQMLANVYGGDPNALQTGHQASFGVRETVNAAWNIATFLNPIPTAYIRHYIQGLMGVSLRAMPAPPFTLDDLYHDAWGNAYISPDGNRIRSCGPDGTNDNGENDGTYGDDIDYFINTDVYDNNNIVISVTDAEGTILRGFQSTDLSTPQGTWLHQIMKLEISGPTLTSSYLWDYGNPGMYQNGTWTQTNVPAGFYEVAVHPTCGGDVPADPDYGTYNHCDDLMGEVVYESATPAPPHDVTNDEIALRKFIVVYPRGLTVFQMFKVQFPGVVDRTELGDTATWP